jgi:AcrR family transcriptional regulator
VARPAPTSESSILGIENNSRKIEDDAPEAAELSPAAARAVRRSLARREQAYQDEVQRLLDAGLALLMESEGHAAPRVADIVARAGLSNQAFYRHFSGKDDLIAAIVDAGAHRLDSYLRHRVERVGLDDQLRAWIDGVLSQAARPAIAAPTRAAMVSFRRLDEEARQAVNGPHSIGLLEEILERLESPDPARDAVMISIAVFGRLEDLLGKVEPTDADVAHAVEFCLAAVRR